MTGHVELGDHSVGERYAGHDWRQAVVWARVRADQVFVRFGDNDFAYWAGNGPLPQWDGDGLRPLPERPIVYADEWVADLGRLQRRVEEREGGGSGGLASDPPRRSGPRQRDLKALERADEAQAHDEPPQAGTWSMLSFAVEDLEERVRRLQELGGEVVQRGRFHAVVEDREGNRALLALLRQRPSAAR